MTTFDDVKDIDWDSVTDSSVEDFSFNGMTFTGKCVKTYDGDSVKVVIYLFNRLCKVTLRLAGVDCPEIRSSYENEKKFAQVVKLALSNKILNKLITVRFYHNDKYGRSLCDIYLGDEHINKWLIDNKYAVEYHGGTKQNWYQMLLDNNY